MRLRIDTIIVYASFFVLFFCTVIFINTGFDIFDEGYYLQGYLREQPIFFQLSGFHHLVRLLPFSDDLLLARIYRIALLILSAFLFAKSLHRYVFTDLQFSTVLAYTLLGNFLSYVHGPASISYNTLSLVLLEVLVSFYLSFRTEMYLQRSSFLKMIVFGFFLGVAAFNKPSSAMLIALLFVIDQVIYKWELQRLLISTLITVAIVSMISFAAAILFFYGSNIREILILTNSGGMPVSNDHVTIKFFITQLFWNTIVQSKKFLIYTVVFLVIYFAEKKIRPSWRPASWLAYGGVLLFVFYKYRNVYFNQPGAEYIYAIAIFIIIIWLYENFAAIKNRTLKFDFHFLFMMLLLPFAGFWGSNNPPMLGVIHYTVFVLLMLLYLNKYVKFSFFVLLPLFFSGFTVYNYLVTPFYNPPVWQQKSVSMIKRHKIKVSDYANRRIRSFDSVNRFIDNNVPLIPVDIPNGLLYVYSKTSYSTIYFNTPSISAGYLHFLLIKGIPLQAQVLINKNHNSELIKKELSNLENYLLSRRQKLTPITETADYILYHINAQ